MTQNVDIDLATGGNSKCNLILQVLEFWGRQVLLEWSFGVFVYSEAKQIHVVIRKQSDL